jgi:dihydrofolate reductase
MLKLIVANCRNGGIGKNNMLPWNLKPDLIRFKMLTVGKNNNAIIMGKNTWESIGSKPLKQRKNIVVSTTMEENDKCIVKPSLDKAVSFCNKNNFDESWIIGGQKLYESAMKTYDIDEIYMTEIYQDFDCDTFFPQIPDNYYIIYDTLWKQENEITYKYVTLKNKISSNYMFHNVLPRDIVGI